MLAYQTMLDVDIESVQALKHHLALIQDLQTDIKATLEQGHKVYIIGCGASGRLAASLAYCHRQTGQFQDQVISIIAGGDAALIRSIEHCEDQPQLGVKQLLAQGFNDNDLLIGSSASGESPFILGAVSYAAENSQRKPWLLYCNANEILLNRNSNHPIAHSKVKSFFLEIGPMALTGSTRLQATTAMMLAIGLGLFYKQDEIEQKLDLLITAIKHLPIANLLPFIEKETQAYRHHEYFLYQVNANCGLTVLADTTERSPTFNILPFENKLDPKIQFSWCYLCIENSYNAEEAWEKLLNKKPLALNWPDSDQTSAQYLYGFDLSETYAAKRKELAAKSTHVFTIEANSNQLNLQLNQNQACIETRGLDLFLQQVLLKLMLNIHSTLVMGKLGFYQGNLMTSLYPSNHKLIDRAIRYTQYRYENVTGKPIDYDETAQAVFKQMQNLAPNQSIVENSLKSLLSSTD
jgi:N-acetylmuramic acid 6-phosphate etherase